MPIVFLIEFFIITPTRVAVERLTILPNETAIEAPTVTLIPKPTNLLVLKLTAFLLYAGPHPIQA